MNFQQTLEGLKIAIDKELELHFDIAIEKAQKQDALVATALEQTKKIALTGGKRIRGALLAQAYFGMGGKEEKKILKVAAAIELVHLFLLVHDDIMDRGEKRHGQETLHIFFLKKSGNDDSEHFGQSVAIILGDMLHAMANNIIIEAGFSDRATLAVIWQLQNIVQQTIIGQAQDIGIENKKSATENEVLAMYENKTARYTFEGPLHLGAILAECCDAKVLQSLSDFAVPVGIAFQIQDDILGVFGNEEKIGKSVASDVEEGKLSLLVINALNSCSLVEKKTLNEILGKKNLTKENLKSFQEIIIKTNSLKYAQKLADKYFNEADRKIAKIKMLPDAKSFLQGLVTYLKGREI